MSLFKKQILIRSILVYGSIVCLLFLYSCKSNASNTHLPISFSGDAQIEVGSYYAGIEFHHSFPAPQRISFYYPVANSLDVSHDYWTRDSTFILSLAIGENPMEMKYLNDIPFAYTHTPYSVSFSKNINEKEVNITYDFCKDKPAVVLTIKITNTSHEEKDIYFHTGWETSFRSCHSYAWMDKANTEYDANTQTYFAHFDREETNRTQLFITNAAEAVTSFSNRSCMSDKTKSNWWKQSFIDTTYTLENNTRPAAYFLYKKKVRPNTKLTITQIIGTCKKGEEKALPNELKSSYKNEIKKLDNYVQHEINKNKKHTGDSVLDQSIDWAKAIIAVNKHYIDGSVEPMPCPAEYNFYFTHDVLLTDMARVFFDLPQVKNDLEFILKHADRYVIPHAYYWKDSRFVTEICTPDDWNHLWFIIVSANYVRHSHNVEFAKRLVPYLQASIENVMLHLKNNAIYAYRPDWWDFGKRYGPSAFMTILGTRALQDMVFIEDIIHNKELKAKYEDLAKLTRNGLTNHLWNSQNKYLMNYFEDGVKDEHLYMGSLLAVHFDLLNPAQVSDMVTTASKYLLDKNVGIYTVTPMDFEQDSIIKQYQIKGDEAGMPHKYINGGIWMHANAFYALALMSAGRRSEAKEFIKRIMSISGIMNSPNGQPAMYEYRNSNALDYKQYGKVDKPQFMWAAGWYLYCVYNLYEWNK